jgi:putative membrane protein
MTVLAALPLLNWGSGHSGWWPIWPLFWAALIGLAVWLVLRRRRDDRSPFDPARAILAERFAKGELDAEEYRARLDELQRHSPQS